MAASRPGVGGGAGAAGSRAPCIPQTAARGRCDTLSPRCARKRPHASGSCCSFPRRPTAPRTSWRPRAGSTWTSSSLRPAERAASTSPRRCLGDIRRPERGRRGEPSSARRARSTRSCRWTISRRSRARHRRRAGAAGQSRGGRRGDARQAPDARAAGARRRGRARVHLVSRSTSIRTRPRVACGIRACSSRWWLSASRGVIRADDEAGFVAAFRRIRAILAAPDVRELGEGARSTILVEDFVPGVEVALEGLLTTARLEHAGAVRQAGPARRARSSRRRSTSRRRGCSRRACRRPSREATTRRRRALGLATGPVHAELRVQRGDGGARAS